MFIHDLVTLNLVKNYYDSTFSGEINQFDLYYPSNTTTACYTQTIYISLECKLSMKFKKRKITCYMKPNPEYEQ